MFGDTSETMLENGANSFKPGRKNEADDKDDLAINNLSTILTEADEDSLYELRKHWRCAAYTLNLVATADSEKAFFDSNYKKVNRSAVGKAVALWNKQQ